MVFSIFQVALIDSESISIPLLQNVAEIANRLYIIIGGFITVFVVATIFKLRESWLLRKRLRSLNSKMDILEEKMDLVLKEKKPRKKSK